MVVRWSFISGGGGGGGGGGWGGEASRLWGLASIPSPFLADLLTGFSAAPPPEEEEALAGDGGGGAWTGEASMASPSSNSLRGLILSVLHRGKKLGSPHLSVSFLTFNFSLHHSIVHIHLICLCAFKFSL